MMLSTLTDQEKTAYLANLWLVARADKALSGREEAVIALIQKNLQAKRALNSAAQKVVEAGGFSLTKVGSFATQVQNLEDMVTVALADSHLDQAEAGFISSFSELIGINHDQLALITSQVSKNAESLSATIACVNCSAQVESTARFCPKCGAALENRTAPTMALDLEIPSEGYAITFCESAAAGFTVALGLAKEVGVVQSALKNKKTWYLVKIDRDRFVDVVRMGNALSGIRNRAVYRDGQQMDWDELFGFVWCANQRNQAFKPVEYCFGKDDNRINPWGCKQARMEWNDWSPWLSFGHWERTGIVNKRDVWVFDKERIRHDLATNLHRFRFCPYLNQGFVEAVILALPDRVEVTSNGPWKYSTAYEETPGSIKIVEKEGTGDFSYTREYYADGVRPRGLLPLHDILNKAFSTSAKKPEISPQTVLSK
jgi:uncharacterized tellurite resistance protein B-like protein